MWPIIKKAVNSDLSTPLNVLIDSVKTVIDIIKTVIDTINVNVGSNANASSATGSLHAKVRDIKDFLPILKKATIIVSDNVRISADTERTLVGTMVLTKLKEIRIGEPGTYRVSFEGRRGIVDAQLQIFVNGVKKGSLQSLNTYYQVFTEDVSLYTGDLVQIYGKNSDSSGTVYLKNFKIAWDYSRDEVILD